MALFRPLKKPQWATSLSALISEPSSAKKALGWIIEKPPLQTFNWLQKGNFEWIDYLDKFATQNTAAVLDTSSLQILGGGWIYFNTPDDVLSWSEALTVKIPGIEGGVERQIAADSIEILSGEVAVISVELPMRFKCNTTSGSPTLSNVSDLSTVAPGMYIWGAGIPPATTVSSIDVVNNTLTMDANATVTNTDVDAWGFTSAAASMSVEPEETFVPGPNKIIFARRVGERCYVGNNGGAGVLRYKETKKLYEDGYLCITSVVAGENLVEGDVVYLSDGPTPDGGRTLNRAYKTSPWNNTNPTKRSQAFGIVRKPGNTGATVQVVTEGRLPFNPGNTFQGEQWYVGSTAGSMVSSRVTDELAWSCLVAKTVRDEDTGNVMIWVCPESTRQNPMDVQHRENIGILGQAQSNDLLISVVTRGGQNASATNPIYITFPYPSGNNTFLITRKVTSSLSITLTPGNFLGHKQSVDEPIYLYAVDNNGTVELAVSATLIDTDYPVTTLTMVTANTRYDLYQVTGRTNKPVTLLGVLYSNQPTLGVYTTNPFNIRIGERLLPFGKTRTYGGFKIGDIITGSAPITTNYTSGAIKVISTLEIPPYTKVMLYAHVGVSFAATTVCTGCNSTISTDSGVMQDNALTIHHRGASITGSPANVSAPNKERHYNNITGSIVFVHLLHQVSFTTSTAAPVGTRNSLWAVVIG